MPARVLADRIAPLHRPSQQSRNTTPPECSTGLFEAARVIAAERSQLISQIRDALRAGRDDDALRLTRKLCGVSSGIAKRPAGLQVQNDRHNPAERSRRGSPRKTGAGGTPSKR